MHKEAERIYMELLVEIGRAGIKCNINVVWSNVRHKFMLIRDRDYRAENIGAGNYELIGVYNGLDGYPFYSDICGDIYAFIQQETSKEHGYRPELEKLMQTG